jgi:hypothetical protein
MTDRGKDDRLGFVHWGAEILRHKLLRMTGWGKCALGIADSSSLRSSE